MALLSPPRSSSAGLQLAIRPELTSNADETQLHYDSDPTGRSRALGAKGRPLFRVAGSRNDCEEHVTGLFCIFAKGSPAPPPMLIFKGIRGSERFLQGAPPGTVMAMTNIGWITEDAFRAAGLAPQCPSISSRSSRSSVFAEMQQTIERHEQHIAWH